jgi:biofilm PGA synthesis N-glycosyltransferase PgaC
MSLELSLDWLREFLIWVQGTGIYWFALFYFAAYPIVTSIMWITTSWMFRIRWEEESDEIVAPKTGWPPVTVIIPAHNEQAVIRQSLRTVIALDYPDLEVIVVDDGSTDRTIDAMLPVLPNGSLRVVRKLNNEGKALALNDVLPLARGELLLVLDADAQPEPDMLLWMVPHFSFGRTAAVTGNPRVRNTNSFLARLQAIEFSSIVSLLRRSQRIWGRITTVSGVVTMFRKSAVFDVGGFSPNMPTEDIELTWKLQKRFYDVRYEPRAICWMTVPVSLRGLWRQRLRWARGLMQVMRKHYDVFRHWKYRRMWPCFVESIMSTFWCMCFVGLTAIWFLCLAVGLPPAGATPMPNLWGMTIGTICLLQLGTGALIDRRYDPFISRYYPYAVWYPIIYWAILAATTVASLTYLFRRPGKDSITWNTQRKGKAA